MIRAVSDRDELYALLPVKDDIYSGKIRSLADGYGFSYDFCRFWVQEDTGTLISSYYGSAVAAPAEPDADSGCDELSAFLSCGAFSRVFMPYRSSGRLGFSDITEKLCVMKRGSDVKNTDINDKPDCETDISLVQVYEIVRSGFDIVFDKWYTDTSHMLRHGIAKVYTLGKSACAIRSFSAAGTAYISCVCTLPSMRGKGLASGLLGVICAEESEKGNDIFLVCGEELRPFYERAGFALDGYAAEIRI